eukprot:4811587-Pleurochrysis_carterae.AAC.2
MSSVLVYNRMRAKMSAATPVMSLACHLDSLQILPDVQKCNKIKYALPILSISETRPRASCD